MTRSGFGSGVPFVLGLLLTLPVLAELELPRESPSSTLSQKIGTTSVTISYHRPAVKGRAIYRCGVSVRTTPPPSPSVTT